MQKKKTAKSVKSSSKTQKSKIEKNIIAKEVSGIAVVFLGVLSAVFIFFASQSGIIGQPFKSVASGLFGWAHYMLPLAIILLGFYISLAGRGPKLGRKILIFIAVFALIPCFFQLYYLKDASSILPSDLTVWKFIAHMYVEGRDNIINGGVFGGILMTPLVILLGLSATYILIIAASLLSFVYLTHDSAAHFASNIKKIFSKIFSKLFLFIKSSFEKEERVEVDKKEEVEVEVEVEELDIVARKPKYTIQNQASAEDIRRREQQVDFVVGEDPEKAKKRIIKRAEINAPTQVNDYSLQSEVFTIKDTKKPIKQEKQMDIDEFEAVTERKTVIADRRKKDGYSLPPLSLLDSYMDSGSGDDYEKIAQKLEETLISFGVDVSVVNIMSGPTVTRYELQPKSGVKVSRIVALSDDIALNLASRDVRIEAPVPGKSVVGIEVPNVKKNIVSLKEVIASKEFQGAKSNLTIAVGKDIAGNCAIADIRRMPHMLIAGATGSGKSVCINSIITSILYKASPEEVKFIMVDPKKVELTNYNGIPHLLIPVVTSVKKAAGALNWAVEEMSNRYELFNKAGVRDIGSYNESIEDKPGIEKMPSIVIIIDELADLMMRNPTEVEESIIRLAQLARAAGIHLIIATQRPSVNVITGVIKANIPSRLSFAVVSQVDSRTILDMGGAEKLLGNGDMLFHPMGLSKPVRMQGSYVSDKEINAVVEYIKKTSEAAYDEDIVESIEQSGKPDVINVEDQVDELLPAAIDLVVEAGQASVSYLQRRLKLGYGRAARIVDQMEARSIVGPFEGAKPRAVLISKDEWAELKMNDPDFE